VPLPEDYYVRGVNFIDMPHDGDSCTAADEGYDDIDGATVVIKDASSMIIATAELSPGAVAITNRVKEKSGNVFSITIDSDCVFSFSATVPDAAFYSFAIGHRNALTYSDAAMEAGDWKLALTLGS